MKPRLNLETDSQRHVSEYIMRNPSIYICIDKDITYIPTSNIYIYIDCIVEDRIVKAYVRTYVRTYIHTYILTHLLTYIHTYLLTYLLTLVFTQSNSRRRAGRRPSAARSSSCRSSALAPPPPPALPHWRRPSKSSGRSSWRRFGAPKSASTPLDSPAKPRNLQRGRFTPREHRMADLYVAMSLQKDESLAWPASKPCTARGPLQSPLKRLYSCQRRQKSLKDVEKER